jgi:hypothetical protein
VGGCAHARERGNGTPPPLADQLPAIPELSLTLHPPSGGFGFDSAGSTVHIIQGVRRQQMRLSEQVICALNDYMRICDNLGKHYVQCDCSSEKSPKIGVPLKNPFHRRTNS